ncbi:ligase-associated DNA damage response endonuclease PdeM [Gangjinia marincola]|uniref:Ligase-associated DNA damage response endonuclease PdeM n=1 Tax=Gangjinia marincola TaxID=578463 RepID=A0ABN1MHP9_9FLAO
MIQYISIHKQTFVLHPTGAIFWKERSMLLIADVHLGKVAHFRKHGSAVPPKAILKNFDQLDRVVDAFTPATICFLGDLFHSAINSEWHLFSNWVARQTAKLILIAGNHDIISPLRYEAIGFVVGSELALDGFLLTHHPEEREGFFNFCGHIHPGIRLVGGGRQQLKLPCFFKSAHQLIFPAFGEFTGLYLLNPEDAEEVYAITKKEVILVPV